MCAVVENPHVRYFRGYKMSSKLSIPSRTPSLVVMENVVRTEGKFGVGRNGNSV